MSKQEEGPHHIDPEVLLGLAGGFPIELNGQVVKKGTSDDILENRPQSSPGRFIAGFKASAHFKEREVRMGILTDVIGLVRHLSDGRQETYDDKLIREAKKGKKEAAAYGLGRIGNHDFVLFGMHYDFFQGTLGVVVGQKFTKAIELAIKKKRHLVGIYSSAGVRQQENMPGLLQMVRMVNGIKRFKEKSPKPYISVLDGQVWGGISASAVPLGDVTIATQGTNYGFSGPKVIESYEHKRVEEKEQSAEANVKNYRSLDLILPEDKVFPFLERLLKATEGKVQKIQEEDLCDLPIIHDILPPDERFSSCPRGFSTPIDSSEFSGVSHKNEIVLFNPNSSEFNEYEDYSSLIKDPRRPDTETFMFSCFSDFVPLYSRFNHGDKIDYPGIIAGIGRIGSVWYLVTGNQPSYQKVSDRIVKIPSNPTPQDFQYLRRMLDLGKRLGYPLVSFVDTPGAKPTLNAEEHGQSREIAETIHEGISYPRPTLTFITGVLGSGGGLASAPWGDYVAISEKGKCFVAEPTSTTSILYSTSSPTIKEIDQTIRGMRAKAEDQLKLGLVRDVLKEPQGGAEQNPREMAEIIRKAIVAKTLELQGVPRERLLKERYNRLQKLQGIPIRK